MTRWPNQGDQYRTPIPKLSDKVRWHKVHNLFCYEKLNTMEIARAMGERECDIERYLHQILESRQ